MTCFKRISGFCVDTRPERAGPVRRLFAKQETRVDQTRMVAAGSEMGYIETEFESRADGVDVGVRKELRLCRYFCPSS